MKKLSKVMLSVAAAFAMTAAMAVTAMAVDTITGTYDNTTGLVTLDGVLDSGKSQTILVLGEAAAGEEADIAYINQIDNNGTFSSFYLEAGLQSSAPVTYNIKIGGSNKNLQTGTLSIVQNTVTIIIGDASGDGKISSADITRISRYIAKKSTGTGNTGQEKTKPDGTAHIIGDASGDNKISSADITRISRYIAKKSTGTGNTGQELEVLAEAQAAEAPAVEAPVVEDQAVEAPAVETSAE